MPARHETAKQLTVAAREDGTCPACEDHKLRLRLRKGSQTVVPVGPEVANGVARFIYFVLAMPREWVLAKPEEQRRKHPPVKANLRRRGRR